MPYRSSGGAVVISKQLSNVMYVARNMRALIRLMVPAILLLFFCGFSANSCSTFQAGRIIQEGPIRDEINGVIDAMLLHDTYLEVARGAEIV